MRRLLHAILLGLLGAGVVHIIVLLLVPEFSERDAWSRLAMASDLYRMTRLDAEAGGTPVVKSVDPLFYAAACRFDLSEGMVRIKAPGNVPFWSVSVYDRSGHNIYSFNDHSATGRVLDSIVLTPAQMIEIRKNLPEELQGAIFVEAPIDEGMFVIRSFVPDDSWKPVVSRFLEQSSCELQDF
ncbi:DUF1254 domain-containing protein [Mesorhizobium mediterraneum]|uniref:DUF1254 domain-containing protein n=1 Tax=Mesorhizobium mediterraneum TaxID=43617 RepID=A0AB36R6N4_9HYPH|nr:MULTISPECIES: DUF1254 domain-containing protein [Mesorhizobium]AZO63537.1 DUF1254 domain-containing protein [Mesorhizobium sp. M6A.T.Cr.TU.016.01.1.1]PAQ00407.1 DUF1254 domain-containing protein [Mesorhizobium mediterraneum]RUU31666.1 DUF1254 domain-containing protein [Mesorhizobium sp. M6A.T.Ce.TU.016.01.1.1]RVB77855.1 DUF1254 domain-containing protein [Mesorhizobium sp. M6A.T.Cr.TU.014.01.1.1]RWN30889.1 MAG: DUF1254 domain-containing protein [Mesorhizobium sp.]